MEPGRVNHYLCFVSFSLANLVNDYDQKEQMLEVKDRPFATIKIIIIIIHYFASLGYA